MKLLVGVFAAMAAMSIGVPEAESGDVLDRIIAEKEVRLGVRTDAPPFSSIVNDRPAGFSVDLCTLMAEAIVVTSKLDGLSGRLVSVDTADRFDSLRSGKIDVLCGATTATLGRRETISFTIPTYVTGIGAAIRRDADGGLTSALGSGGGTTLSVLDIGDAISGKTLGVRANTTAAKWLANSPLAKVDGVEIRSFDDHSDGLSAVADGSIVSYFADRAILLGQVRASNLSDALLVSASQFTHEPYALAIPRGDEELRLVFDRALSYLYRNRTIYRIYETHFGKPNAEAVLFYTMSALPD